MQREVGHSHIIFPGVGEMVCVCEGTITTTSWCLRLRWRVSPLMSPVLSQETGSFPSPPPSPNYMLP